MYQRGIKEQYYNNEIYRFAMKRSNRYLLYIILVFGGVI